MIKKRLLVLIFISMFLLSSTGVAYLPKVQAQEEDWGAAAAEFWSGGASPAESAPANLPQLENQTPTQQLPNLTPQSDSNPAPSRDQSGGNNGSGDSSGSQGQVASDNLPPYGSDEWIKYKSNLPILPSDGSPIQNLPNVGTQEWEKYKKELPKLEPLSNQQVQDLKNGKVKPNEEGKLVPVTNQNEQRILAENYKKTESDYSDQQKKNWENIAAEIGITYSALLNELSVPGTTFDSLRLRSKGDPNNLTNAHDLNLKKDTQLAKDLGVSDQYISSLQNLYPSWSSEQIKNWVTKQNAGTITPEKPYIFEEKDGRKAYTLKEFAMKTAVMTPADKVKYQEYLSKMQQQVGLTAVQFKSVISGNALAVDLQIVNQDLIKAAASGARLGSLVLTQAQVQGLIDIIRPVLLEKAAEGTVKVNPVTGAPAPVVVTSQSRTKPNRAAVAPRNGAVYPQETIEQETRGATQAVGQTPTRKPLEEVDGKWLVDNGLPINSECQEYGACIAGYNKAKNARSGENQNPELYEDPRTPAQIEDDRTSRVAPPLPVIPDPGSRHAAPGSALTFESGEAIHDEDRGISACRGNSECERGWNNVFDERFNQGYRDALRGRTQSCWGSPGCDAGVEAGRKARGEGTLGVSTNRLLAQAGEGQGAVVGADLSIPVAESSQSLILFQGWNLISLGVRPKGDFRASDLIEELNSKGGDIDTVITFRDGSWLSYIVRSDQHFSGEDFAIELGKGYFIRSNAISVFVIDGEIVRDPVKVNLKTGWNVIGVPRANNLNVASLSDQSQAENISRYDSGLWEGFVKKEGEEYGGLFDISPDRGYILKVNQDRELSI